MREIKFKGKRLDFGEWAYGYFFKHPDGTSSIFVPGEGSFVVDPESVAQFVGYDKNEKDVYEGSKVKCWDNDECIYQIEWFENGFYLNDVARSSWSSEDVEIIEHG